LGATKKADSKHEPAYRSPQGIDGRN